MKKDILILKQGTKGQNDFRKIIESKTGVKTMYFVPVCAFGIVYSVYSDNDCNNLIAEIIY